MQMIYLRVTLGVYSKSGKEFQRSENYKLGFPLSDFHGVRVSVWTSGTLEDLVPDHRCPLEER